MQPKTATAKPRVNCNRTHIGGTHGSILMKTTRSQTEEDIAYVLEVLPTAVNRIRGIVGSTGVH